MDFIAAELFSGLAVLPMMVQRSHKNDEYRRNSTAIRSTTVQYMYELFDIQDNNDSNANNKKLTKQVSFDDDATALTESCSSVCSYDGSALVVSFADKIVSQVYERPVTTREEKRALYYNERDYRRFRQDFFMESSRRVRFAVEDDVYVYAHTNKCDKDELFYSNHDLQRFLDEFLASLDSDNTTTSCS